MLVGITSMLTDRTMSPSELAVAVEERHFDSLWLPEHTHIPTSRESPWPGAKPGTDEPLPEPYSRYVDLLVALSMAAAVTTRVGLGSSVCLVAQHDPIQLAKQVATLDHLSGGRVILGIGYGWNREEAANHGMLEWDARRDIVREKVAAMRALWSDEVASFDGAHVHVAPSWMWPKPAQPHGPKVILGGGWGPKLCEAVAEWADGWMPITARASLVGRVEGLWDACARAGRDPATVEIDAIGVTPDAATLASLRAEGVHRAILTVWEEDRDGALRSLDRFAAVRDELDRR
jgi:probable F420-dependent oxidoreductase